MKKFEKYIIALVLGVVTIFFTGCEEWLDINTDPNNPTEVPLNQLLPSIQVDVAGSVGMSVGGISGGFAGIYMHYYHRRGPSTMDYQFKGDDFGILTPWQIMYPRALTDIRQVISIGEEQEAWHYVGVAQILKAYLFSVLVDMWADVPYSEANLGSEVPFPKYDKGKDIYDEVFQLLNDGIANLAKESSLTPGNDDFFYGGGSSSLVLWRKFAKSLKLKLYNQLRLERDVSGDVNSLLSDDDLLGPGEDFEMQYGGSISPDNRNPGYSQEYVPGGSFNNCSPYFYEILQGQNTFFPNEVNPYEGLTDPRVPYYFYNQLAPGQAAENPTAYKNGEFVSIYMFSYNIDPNEGYDQASSQSILGLYPIGGRYDNGLGGIANFNGAGDTPQRILCYFQRKFIEAELAWAGVTSGNARTLLEEAIRLSFDKVNEVAGKASAPVIDQASIDFYVAAVMTRYDAAANSDEELQHIMTQTWIASYGYAVDAYTDYRRTGYPLLHDGNTDNLAVTVRQRDYPMSWPWLTNDLSINPNAPNQKDVTRFRVFWDVD